MTNIKQIFYAIFILLIFSTNCTSQNNNKGNKQQAQSQLVNRQPAVAGQFYPSDPQELETTLTEFFSEAVPEKYKNVLAIISPHAGYVFSGEVAASSFNQIDKKKNYENIFIIASSHRTSFEGASIYSKGNYITPLGTVKVNIPLSQKLIQENKVFTFNRNAHISEHSLEVQLPFLQYILKNDYQIIPIVLGTQSPETCKNIARILKPYFNENNLFIISTDFSHYPNYKDAVMIDDLTANAIISNSPDNLIKTLKENDEKNIPNLATSLCGWTSVLTLLDITEDNPNIEIIPVQYKNSGDAGFGDKNRVVGYYSIVVSEKKKNINEESEYPLTEKDKKDLLEIARKTIEEYINNNKTLELQEKNYSENLKTHCGAFVTLHKNHRLRGCIGRFTADEPLYKVIQKMAIASATQDSRFPKVTSPEINKLEKEISVLTPMKKIKSIDEIEMGRHGIYIKKGWATGTFLPQVATETGWTKEEFLGHCARDKAGIGWDGWKDAEIFIYEANVFNEKKY
ncbi:MAG: AmmeMemoRadiSam system protein B [Bacteroidales bacterium]|nr:AmmeMemoRadiSam system protein B [Bacteroidales bacterium]